MSNKIIEIRNLFSGYGNKMIVKDLSLDVFEHDFLCITGPNGGGKTTFLKTLLGLLPVKDGNVRFFRNGKLVPSVKTGYLPQISLIDRKFPISARDAVLFGLACEKRVLRSYSAEDYERVEKVMELMGLTGLEKSPIGELSGGQLQRTLFARAIVSSPELLILDEPDSYMDKTFKSRLTSIFRDINKHSAVIVVSHQEKDFASLAKHFLNIDRE